MYFFRFIIIFGLIQVFTLDGFTQLPAVQVNEARFTKEYWGGLVMHSQGFGINFNYSKFKTYKKKRYYTFDFVGMRHEKEYKIFGSIDESAKRYVYGKLNSFMILRVGTGGRKLFLEKLRENGFCVKYTHPNLLFISWNHYINKKKRSIIKIYMVFQ